MLTYMIIAKNWPCFEMENLL